MQICWITPEFIYPYRNQVFTFIFVVFIVWCLKHFIRHKFIVLNSIFIEGGFYMICSGRDKIETPEQVCTLCTVYLAKMHASRIVCIMEEHHFIILPYSFLFSLNKLKKRQRNLTLMGLLLLVETTQIQMLVCLLKTSGWVSCNIFIYLFVMKLFYLFFLPKSITYIGYPFVYSSISG